MVRRSEPDDARSLARSCWPRRSSAIGAPWMVLTALHGQYGFVVGYGDHATFNLTNVLLNALMIRSDINSIMRSMTVECAATPLIFACFFAHKQFGRTSLVMLCAILFGLSFYGPYVHLHGGFTSLAPSYAFVIGVLLHFMVMKGSKQSRVATWAALSLALILVCWLRKQTAIVVFLESFGSATLILLVAANSGDRLFAVLDSIVVRFFGRISYSFYLLHLIGLSLAVRTVPPLQFCTLCLELPTRHRWLGYRGVLSKSRLSRLDGDLTSTILLAQATILTALVTRKSGTNPRPRPKH